MKPFRILIYLIFVALILLFTSVIFPSEGIKLPGGITLKFFSINRLFNHEGAKYADISRILKFNSASEEFKGENVLKFKDEIEGIILDTIRANPDSLKKITSLIQFPRKDPSSFYNLFFTLKNLKSTHDLVRIMHYGDSQIEADRMTSFIRNKLQGMFGGSGCGFIPPVPLYNGKMSIKQEHSSNWQRFTGFSNVDTSLGHKRYGALFSFSRHNSSDNMRDETAWLNFSPSPIGFPLAKNFNRISLYVGGNEGSSSMVASIDDSIIGSVRVSPTKNFKKVSWRTGSTPKNFRIEFSEGTSPEVYGISLDNSWGLAVDNIPLRGSSGLVFSKTDTVFLKKMYKELNVGMLILQFGGNIIPHNAENYKFYEDFFMRELGVLKRMLPGTPIIVIGPSDMSLKENGEYKTYPSLEPVRDAMRTAALQSGCAFWDMYEAMGGENSMPSWVYADPPLAVSDFVHFNHRGASIIGEMFSNAFIYEYNSWLIKNDVKTN